MFRFYKIILLVAGGVVLFSCCKNRKTNEVEKMAEQQNVITGEFYSTWASSQYLTEDFNMPTMELSGNSLRQIVHVSIAGEKIRVCFTNRLGYENLEITEACIAKSKGQGTGSIILDSQKNLTFNGQKNAVIPAGKDLYSDVLDFSFDALEELTVSICYGKVPQRVTGHPGSRTNSFVQKANAVWEKTFDDSNKTAHWYTIAGIEVLSEKPKKAVICFGDSITDGRGSTDDLQNRWTDNFAKLLLSNNSTKDVAVINQGIGGTCVTTDGARRFDRDVLAQKGITSIVMLYGINDIIYMNASSQTVIECYKSLINKAHKKGIKIYGGTILPFGNCGDYSEKRDEVRMSVNNWIRRTSSSDGGFDGFIDFDAVMRDDSDISKMKLPCDCGDGLHPSAKGYETMAEAFQNLEWFE